MKNLYTKNILIFAVLLCFALQASAQQGCPFVNAGADKTIPCNTNCTSLTATYFETGNTNTYAVSQIPYAPLSYTAGTNILVNTDDIWSDVIDLPFTFCFFGNAYTQVVVGANGLITFDVTEANLGCNWNTETAGQLPTTNMYTNTIMGPYQDIDPSLGGTIKYQIIGTAPCRMFVISYNQIPMYDSDNFLSDCSGDEGTSQIILYETTNAIEIYIAKKTACPGGFLSSDWNMGLGTEGIQNAAGTVAYVVAGRNNSVWTATNDARRFTPNGPSIVTVDWLQNGAVIGTGATVSVCPTSNTTYTARATYLPCNGGTPVVETDVVNVSLAGLRIDTTIFQHPTCNGATNGTITTSLITTSAVPPVTYGWSNGQNTLTISNLAAGTYIFTATDAANCLRSDTVVLVDPPLLTVTVPDVSQTNCAGSGTGTLLATPNGGTPGYSYSWNSSPVQNDSILNGVAAGTYNVVLTDAKGCTATDAATLTILQGNNNVVIAPAAITNITCFGDNDGAITVSASGNSGVFTYTWNGGPLSGATISSLAPGNYALLVDDGGGCTASATYVVTEPADIVLAPAVVQSIGCVAGTTGSITVSATGGTGVLNYNWTRQSNSQTYTGAAISNLQADTYVLTVSDANGCSATQTSTVTQVTPLSITESSTNVSCNGGTDGTASITVNTGTPPYQYNWNGTGNAATGSIGNLAAGPVTVVVTDANCSASASMVITEPTAVVIALVSTTNVSCFGYTDGEITVSASGGTGAYQYLWSDGQTTATATGLTADVIITVTAYDANQCFDTAQYQLTQPPVMSASTAATDAVCFQSPTGTLTANVLGGVNPYAYLWSDAQNTKTATGLLANTYQVVVTDANGCSVSAAGVVTEPAALFINSITTTAVKCPGQENGTITVVTSGGTLPHNYSATQDGSNFMYATNGVIIGLDTGEYLIIISDNAGCTYTETAIVPDAVADVFTVSTDSTSCFGSGYNDGALYISTASTSGPYWYSIDGGAQQQQAGEFYGLAAGEYTIMAISANECTTQVVATVSEPLEMQAQVIPDTVTLALGESAQVQVSYNNGNNVSYQWQSEYALSCGDCANPVVTAYNRTDYVVTVSMQSGLAVCTATAKLHVAVLEPEPVYVPNAFTPNGDGNNDMFMVYGQDIKTASLKVFNRWGELLFVSNNQFSGWDGTYKGQPAPTSVYTYVAEVTYLNNTTTDRKGTVNLIR